MPKEVFSSGEIARICHVSPRSAHKWIDSGALKGYRLPGSRDRRVAREELLAFLRKHEIPFNRELLGMTDEEANLTPEELHRRIQERAHVLKGEA